MKQKAYGISHFKDLGKSEGAPEGTFEAIVSVFGNVDKVGDRVMPGAFEESLKAWGESGDPIPVIWSHQWDNPFAHIGKVLEAKEVEEGLWIKGQIDLDEEFAAQVFRKLQNRTVREFSFAYNVIEEAQVKEDERTINNLIKLDVFEVGPTLKGCNPATQLLAAKTALDGAKAGRVLSKANESKLAQATDLLNEVLSSVKDTPEEDPKTSPDKDETKADADESGSKIRGQVEREILALEVDLLQV